MFSSQNFVIPVSLGDKVLKIRNVKGQLVHIIRDATCTIKQEGVNIFIKQQAESQVVTLDFVSAEDCTAAHLVLRDALIILNHNTNTNQQFASEYEFSPISNSTIGVNFTMNIPKLVTLMDSLYVNGIYVSKDFYIATLTGSTTNIIWKSTAEYPLETTDVITIKYY